MLVIVRIAENTEDAEDTEIRGVFRVFSVFRVFRDSECFLSESLKTLREEVSS